MDTSITVADGKGFRIRGEEDVWRRKERTTYRQLLWCIPAREADLELPQRHPDDIDDERAALAAAVGPTYGSVGKRA